jgi:UDP-N-acetylglucosamine 4,6-dehydratase/UDP-glucose 4-epimerase
LFEGKKILITGGTGSLGQALTKRLLKLNVDTIRILSRNESKQVEMESKFHDERLRFLIGDVRDYNRLTRALEGIDIVFHAAALKHVPLIEYNPFEAIKTNVLGSQNIIDACLHENVKLAVAVGTDKAVSPLNAYGATKLLMEKLFITARNYLSKKSHPTKFIALRYGNVLGSSGSVIPKWIDSIENNKKITITAPQMTRFSITMEEALDFILESAKIAQGSEIFVPKLRAYSLLEIKELIQEIFGNSGEETIGIRSGEKMHEVLINQDELNDTWDIGKMYMILQSENRQEILEKYQNPKKVEMNHPYASNFVEKIPRDILKKEVVEEFAKKN